MKKFTFDPHLAAFEGASKLAKLVSTTLGPRGRNVILHKKGQSPITSKDGVTVAKFVELEDPYENAAAQIIKQAAEETETTAGDGTTTSTVIAHAILEQAQRYLASSRISAVDLKRGIDVAVEHICEIIKSSSKSISSREDIQNIATISSNGDEVLGKLVAEAVDAAGKDGALIIENSNTLDTHLDLIEGFRFDAGYMSSTFVNDEVAQMVKYDEPFILVTDYTINQVEQLMPTLQIAAATKKPIIIIGDIEYGSQALAALIMNAYRVKEKQQGAIKAVAVKPPRFGSERHKILKDLALTINAKFISKESGNRLEDVVVEDLGTCAKIEIKKNMTTIIGGRGDRSKINMRIKSLKTEIEQTDSIPECKQIQERITRLSSGIAVIYLGAATEVELIEKRHRLEDALEAVRSAQEEGIVMGGGAALLYAAEEIKAYEFDCSEIKNDTQTLGVDIVANACRAPIRKIIENGGGSADVIINELLKENNINKIGYNAATEEYNNLFEDGVIDPAKVVRCALQNGASAAGAIILSSAIIVEI